MFLTNCLLAATCFSQQPPSSPPSGAPIEKQEPAPSTEATPPVAAPPASDSRQESRVVDEARQIVNEDMLTSRSFLRAMYMENGWKPFANKDEAIKNEQKVIDNSVRYALKIQAGQDMGLDPAQVDRQVKAVVADRRDRLGAAEFAAMLQKRSMTLFEYQDWIKDQLFSTFWENYITGAGTVGQARQSRDRFVRPGFLQFTFKECLDHPELLPKVGGRSQTIVVQQLIVDPKSAGGPDAAHTLMENLRRRILEGADMSDLVDLYGATKVNHGISEPLVESLLVKYDPALGAFVPESKVGDLSEVHEYNFKGYAFWRIVRILEREPAVVPELASIEIQKKVEEVVKSSLSDWRLDQALKIMFRASYVWTPTDTQR